MLTLEMIQDAQAALKGVARVTPLNPAKNLGKNVYIKAENLQLTGAFKLRGAYNKMRSLTPEEREKGVIACSAGNHAQGIALSATRLGIKSIICMPAGAPISKVEATKNYGAEVVLVPGVYDDAAAEAGRLVQEKGYTFAHPFNDEMVMAGQGTIGLEILEQLPEVDQVVVPIGGGGLISGIACAIKALKPSCKVIGVQAASVASMYASRKAGKVCTVPDGDTIADGIHVLTPGTLTFELCQKYVDEIVTVKEDEIATAILALMEDQKTVAEGAGATPVAAVMFGKVDATNKKTVCVVSGGNVDVTTLSRIITKGLTKTGRIAEIATKVADKPGSLIRLLQIVSNTGANIISINHAREDKHSDVGACIVSMVLETRNPQHVDDIEHELETNGYSLLRD
ncbi:threonine ammonia-lyase [Oscillibacter sp.]|uniref:threonine ammonia-lyase n=1 Tax=Oscillibacter sp. TaxID=1945593 RepID=UPI0026286285|nr:threonine ammonia-lyase [Oscillibacter sp.]MDD3347861.1 threonine ammonia-lyase [Oscillibacter sp.]